MSRSKSGMIFGKHNAPEESLLRELNEYTDNTYPVGEATDEVCVRCGFTLLTDQDEHCPRCDGRVR